MNRRRGKQTLEPEQELLNFLKSIESFLQKGKYPSFTLLLETIFNFIMKKERELFLENNPQEHANGFYKRTLSANYGTLQLKIPRVRHSNSFRPALLPERWKRFNKDYEEFILACLANGYSKTKIKSFCEKLQIPFSENALQTVEELILEKLEYFKIKSIPDSMFAVFIDAYHTQIREDNKMIDFSIFVAVGIDLKGYKHILGYWTLKGKENLGFWTEVLQDLISRGLSKVAIFVTDHFNGLDKLIAKLFPLADHQFCFVHLYRNLKNKLNLKSTKEIYKIWKAIKEASSLEEGQELFKKLLDLVKSINPNYARYLERYSKNFLAFLRYPEEVRKHIYTTNIVESINAGLEFMRMEHGGYFASYKMLDINLFIQLINLHDRWLEKPNPHLAANSYRLRQLFNMKYLEEDEKIIEIGMREVL
jgi:transposase-like protein